MSCEAIRAAMRATGAGQWPSEVLTHLATCDACVEHAVDAALKQRPSTDAPVTFAVDVARAARLETPSRHPRSRALIAGLVAAVVAIAVTALSLAPTNLERGALPAGAFLLACAVGLAVTATTLNADVVRPRFRG